jgi:hypothetical protein
LSPELLKQDYYAHKWCRSGGAAGKLQCSSLE